MSDRLAIVLINGFRQGAGPDEGLYRLYRRLCARWFDRREALVLYRTWDSNHQETADLIRSFESDRVVLVGYSYGCGWGCTQMAAMLGKHEIAVDQLFLVDPVPRYKFIPAKIKSLTRGGRFRVPATVHQVTTWQQVNKRGMFDPVGHEIETRPGTKIMGKTYIGSLDNLDRYAPPPNTAKHVADYGVNHSNIDDYGPIHDEIVGGILEYSP